MDVNIPVLSDAVLAEVVSTWCADWISEYIQTDGAQKLIFSEGIAGSGHLYTKNKRESVKKQN